MHLTKANNQFNLSIDIGSNKIALVIFNIINTKIRIIKSYNIKNNNLTNKTLNYAAIKNKFDDIFNISSQKINNINTILINADYEIDYHNLNLKLNCSQQSTQSQLTKQMLQTTYNVVNKKFPHSEIIDFSIQPKSYKQINQLVAQVQYSSKLLTIKRNASNKIRQLFNKQSQTNIISGSYAAALACSTEQERQKGLTFLDIGANSTKIICIKNNQLLLKKIIYIGGNHITNDIAILFNIPISTAEQLKKNFGASINNNTETIEVIDLDKNKKTISTYNLFNIINSRIEEIIDEAINCLYISKINHLVGRYTIITGGSSNIKGMQEKLETKLNKKVRIGPKVNLFAKSYNPVFINCIGMIIYKIIEIEKYYNKDYNIIISKNNNKIGFITEYYNKIKKIFHKINKKFIIMDEDYKQID